MANEAVRVLMVSGGGSSGQVRVLQVTGAGAGTGLVRVTGVSGTTPALFGIDAGLPQTLDPFQIVQLNAVVTTTGQTADTWVWTQTAGPTVTLGGFGPSVQYRAPATMRGTTLTFQVTATGGGNTVTDTVTHTIRSHSGMWKVSSAGVLYGIERRRTARIPLAPPQPVGQTLTTLPTRTTQPTLTTQG